MSMKKDMILGSSYYNCPSDGAGPLRELFPRPLKISKFSDLHLVDAIVIWGGSDISPSLYYEKPIDRSGPEEPSKRDEYELAIVKHAMRNNIPLIGVCRGAQLICALAGGKLIQDVKGHECGNHEVTTSDGTTFSATSAHHQMMWPYDISHELLSWSTKRKGDIYLPSNTNHAKAMKGKPEPECVFFPQIKALCIQSHPEWESAGSFYNKWFLDQIVAKCFGKVVA